MSPRPPAERPLRVTDRPGPLMRSLITEWRWPITLFASLCLVIAAVLYALDRPLAGFVDQLSGLLQGGAVLAIVLACFRIFAAVRQMAGAERQAGGARSEVVELRAEVADLRASLAELVGVLRQGRSERGGGRRREQTSDLSPVADAGITDADGNHRGPRLPG